MAYIDEILEKAYGRKSSSEVARLLMDYGFAPEEARSQGKAFALWVNQERARCSKNYDKKLFPRRKRTPEEREILKAARAILRAAKEERNAGRRHKARRSGRAETPGV